MFPIFEKYPTNNPHPLFEWQNVYSRTSAAQTCEIQKKKTKEKNDEKTTYFISKHIHNLPLEWCPQTHIPINSHTNKTFVKKIYPINHKQCEVLEKRNEQNAESSWISSHLTYYTKYSRHYCVRFKHSIHLYSMCVPVPQRKCVFTFLIHTPALGVEGNRAQNVRQTNSSTTR